MMLREISGMFLWQQGADRVLHTLETCNIISLIENWEDVEAQQVNEERTVNTECEESDLIESKVNHEIVAVAANNISGHSNTDMESTAEICHNLVVDGNFTSHAAKNEEAISESGLTEEDVIIEEEQVKIEDNIKVETIENL